MTITAKLDSMRTLLVAPDPEWLEERRRCGIDRRDEVWDGVLHVPPEPSPHHQRIEGRLARWLSPLAEARNLECLTGIAILDPANHDKNYRVPDIIVIDPRQILRRGTEGPVIVAIEVLSPHDESREKFAFYAARGVKEVWIVDPDTRDFEVYTLRSGVYFAILPDETGRVRAPALDLTLSLGAGPVLHVAWAGGSAEI